MNRLLFGIVSKKNLSITVYFSEINGFDEKILKCCMLKLANTAEFKWTIEILIGIFSLPH